MRGGSHLACSSCGAKRLHSIYVSAEYDAVAILTNCSKDSGVPYLCKFAVNEEAQVCVCTPQEHFINLRIMIRRNSHAYLCAHVIFTPVGSFNFHFP